MVQESWSWKSAVPYSYYSRKHAHTPESPTKGQDSGLCVWGVLIAFCGCLSPAESFGIVVFRPKFHACSKAKLFESLLPQFASPTNPIRALSPLSRRFSDHGGLPLPASGHLDVARRPVASLVRVTWGPCDSSFEVSPKRS